MTSHAATIMIVVTLSSGGYWFGGDEGQVTLAWPVDADMPAANLIWTLALGDTVLGSGEARLEAGQRDAVVRLTPPPVTTRVHMTWHWRLTIDGGGDVHQGRVEIDVFPASLLEGAARRMEPGRLIVLDPTADLANLLACNDVPHRRVTQSSSVVDPAGSIVLVAPDALKGRPQDHVALANLAEAGASILVLAHRDLKVMMDYPVTTRARPERLTWRHDHPLLQSFSRADLSAWFEHGGSEDVHALRLPPDAPALALAVWPVELLHDQPAPVDALLVTRAQGKGRIVLCQLPMDWRRPSPRELTFLAGAIEYLRTRPEPTPPPGDRTREKVERILTHLIEQGLLGDQP